MYFVYILQDPTNDKLCVGRTNRLDSRMDDHAFGKVWTTRRMHEPELIFYEAFKAKEDAIRRERYLKTSKGRSTIRQMLRAWLRRE